MPGSSGGLRVGSWRGQERADEISAVYAHRGGSCGKERRSLVNVGIRAIQRAMDIGDEVSPAVIDGSDPARPVEDVSPLGHTVSVTGRSESARAL